MITLHQKKSRKANYTDQYGNQRWLKATYGFDVSFAERYHQAPYFAITAKSGDSTQILANSFGCQHDDIMLALPELQPLLKWRLVAYPGLPIHYIANAVYWAQDFCGVSQFEKHSYALDPLLAYFHAIVFPAYDGENIADVLSILNAYRADYQNPSVKKMIRAEIKRELTPVLEARLPLLQSCFEREMRAFELLTGNNN